MFYFIFHIIARERTITHYSFYVAYASLYYLHIKRCEYNAQYYFCFIYVLIYFSHINTCKNYQGFMSAIYLKQKSD